MPFQDPLEILRRRQEQAQQSSDPLAVLRERAAPEQEPQSYLERLWAGGERELSAANEMIQRVQEGLGVQERLGPGPSVAEGIETAQAGVSWAARKAGEIVGNLFHPGSPGQVMSQFGTLAKTFLPQDEQGTYHLPGAGGDITATPAAQFAAESTGVPATARTAGRAGRFALHPMQQAGEFADAPFSSSIMAGLDASLARSLAPSMIGRALQSGSRAAAPVASESLNQLGPARPPAGLLKGAVGERAALPEAGLQPPSRGLPAPSVIVGQPSLDARAKVGNLIQQRIEADELGRAFPGAVRLKVVDEELAAIDAQIGELRASMTPEFVARAESGEASTLLGGTRDAPAGAVAKHWNAVTEVTEAGGMPRDVQGRFVAAAIGKTRPTTLAEQEAAISALRRGLQGERVPAADEIRSAVREMRSSGEIPARPPGVEPGRRPPPAFRTRERTQPRTGPTVHGNDMPPEILEDVPADAIFEQDMVPWSIAGAGQRTKQAVRDWVTWGSQWADFDYVNFGVGQSLREGIGAHHAQFKAATDALKGVEKALRKDKNFERAVANVLLHETPSGIPAVDDAAVLIRGELQKVYALEGQQGPIGFVEGYLPIIRRLETYGGLQQTPSDIQRFAALRVMNPHRKIGPNKAARIRFVQRVIENGDANVADLVRLRLYTGYREVSLNPVLEKAEQYLLASREVTSLGLRSMDEAVEAISAGRFGPTRTRKLAESVTKIRELGKREPLTVVQQDGVTMYLPKFTGKQLMVDIETRLGNFARSRGLIGMPSQLNARTRTASRLTRNTLTGLIGFQARTSIKQISQLQNTMLDVGVLPTALGALMMPTALTERTLARGANVVLRSAGSAKQLPLWKAPHELLGSVRGEIDMLALRELQGRFGRAYGTAAFAQLEAAEHVVRGISYWAGVISHGLRASVGTAERELASGAIAKTGFRWEDAFRHGVATATKTQFHYGAASESPLFAAFGSLGIMANGLTTFGRKQAAFTVGQLVERPIVQARRLGRAAKGFAAGEQGIGMAEVARELRRVPQELLPLVRFYASIGAMNELSETMGVNLDDVSGFGPITGMWRFGQPFAVFQPLVNFINMISTYTDDNSTIQDQAQATVEFAESASVYAAIPTSAIRAWSEFYRDQFVNPGVRTQTRPADPFGMSIGNVPLARHLASGGRATTIGDIPTGTSRGTTMEESVLRALIGEPLAFANQREMMSELTRIGGEFQAVREQGIIRGRAKVLTGLSQQDSARVLEGLNDLMGYNVNLETTFDAPILKQIEAMSDDEEIWAAYRLMQIRSRNGGQ